MQTNVQNKKDAKMLWYIVEKRRNEQYNVVKKAYKRWTCKHVDDGTTVKHVFFACIKFSRISRVG